ncbi:hypothetical protein LM601244_140325 [Listeria monocytogenes]|nr:hypothetical protein LM601244_140325 [Listeria monocytogenes]
MKCPILVMNDQKRAELPIFLDTFQNIQTCKKDCIIGLKTHINILFK